MEPSSTRRGRRALVSAGAVLERIRRLDRREDGLFRVHRRHGSLYARARRQFGSWALALGAAGIDYRATLERARARAATTRRRRGREGPGAAKSGTAPARQYRA